MLSKCANPACSAQFLYLSRGELYKVETTVCAKSPDRPDFSDAQSGRTERRCEYFWLCEECTLKVRLTYDRATGVKAAPLARAARAF